MINTIRSQIIIAVTAVMLVSAIVIIMHLHKDANKSIGEIERKSILNILNFIDLSLTDNFNYRLRSKYKMYNIHKKRLMIDMNYLFHYYGENKIIEKLKDNYMSKNNETKNMAANPKRMIIDKLGKIKDSTEEYLIDKHIKNSERDGKLYLSESGQFSIFCISEDGNCENYKFGYFKPISDKTGSKLKIGFFYNKEDFDVKSDKNNNEIVGDLDDILNHLRIAETGFSFIFHMMDKRNEIKIITIPNEKKREISFCRNTPSNKSCLEMLVTKIDKMKKIDKIRDQYIIENLPFKGVNLSVYIEYFKGFDWHYAVIFPTSEIEEPVNTLVRKLLLIVILIISFSIVITYLIISKVTKPLGILSQKMRKVSEHNFTGDDHSELLDGLPVTARNEAGQLAKTFSFMIDKLSVSIKHLVETTAVNERRESELNVAKNIQLGILPQDFSEPKRKNADIYAYLKPAREIGGDLYDFFFMDDEHLCFAVGDVADKGVSAALVMFCAKKMISSHALKGETAHPSPAEIMRRINDILSKDNASATFVTLFIGILNVKNGKLLYANGGHVPPIFVDCGSEPKYRKDMSGPAVGIRPGIQYRDLTAVMPPGGAVFLCTDGVTEAMDENDKLFGDKRLLDDFSCMKDKSCQEVVEGILYEVRMHAGKAPQSDDIAMLMLRWGVKGEDKENHE